MMERKHSMNLANELPQKSVDDLLLNVPHHLWTEPERVHVLSHLEKLRYFKEAAVSRDVIEASLDRIRQKIYHADEPMFQQGEVGKYFFVVLTGQAQFFVNTPKGAKVLGVARPGDGFGELAFITGKPRAVGARAATHCHMLLFDEELFLRLFKGVAERKVVEP